MKASALQRWATLGPRLDELLTLPPAARTDWLDRLALHDPETAGQLRALLSARDDASGAGFLGGVADAGTLPTVVAAGEVLGAWTLVELIGEGGMGSVWRARRSDGRFEGEAAVKLLKTGLYDASTQERFRREGGILARLQHPGIARLLDAGVSSGGQPYLVLELVRGRRIDQWCSANGLALRQRIELFLQVTEAVSAAHNLLVIHRDLKPSNILVDEDGRVRLLDFGIARLLADDEVAGPAGLTREGAFALTPAFAAPEQFQGGTLSMATDVYALGVVLHGLLTGKLPSGLEAEAPLIEHLRAAVEGRHRPASQQGGALSRALRGDLDTIIAKCLAVAPAERYASAADLRADLQRHLRHEPIAARAERPLYRLAKLVRRRPFESAIVAAIGLAIPAGAHLQAAVLVVMGAAAAVSLWQVREARAQAAAARAAQLRAESVKDFIASALGKAVPREGSGGVVTAADLLHSAAERVLAELGTQPAVAAELLAIVCEGFMEFGDVNAGLRWLKEAVPRCEAALGPMHLITLRARTSLMEARNATGDGPEARRLAQALLPDLRRAMPSSADILVHALGEASGALVSADNETLVITQLQEAAHIATQHFGSAHRDTLFALAKLGNTLQLFGRRDEAVAVLEPAVFTARQAFGAQRPHSLLASLETHLATSLASQARLPQAIELMRQTLADQLQLDCAETPRSLHRRFALARTLFEHGALEDALEQVAQVKSHQRQHFPGKSLAIESAVHACMLAAAGRHDEAVAEVVASGQDAQSLAADHPSWPLLLAWHGEVLTQAGRLAEARVALDRAAALDNVKLPEWSLWRARLELAWLRHGGRLTEADAQAGPLLALVGTGNAYQAGRAVLEVMALRSAQGRTAEADQAAQEALRLLSPIQQAQSPWLAWARGMQAGPPAAA